ncbi:biliverdin-producing heme oxygenase [Pseudoalteromonas piscicida]|uniref:biliverdin-producing heme oxygenase n=1 Tax=Pseudoalteromonas piscicida TaxID=43662 RepID=UPI00309B3C78
MSKATENRYPRMTKLRQATTSVHDTLDARLIGEAPFASTNNYVLFLQFQHALMHYVDPLYHCPKLASLIPDLQSRNRIDVLADDLQDFDASAFTNAAQITLDSMSLARSLGWLYVIEGSKLGAAMLGKEVSKLSLTSEFGARFLAGPGVGRGNKWREFMAAIEAAPLTDLQEQELLDGAKQAFAYTHQLVDEMYQKAS